jgi:hypothetical protein
LERGTYAAKVLASKAWSISDIRFQACGWIVRNTSPACDEDQFAFLTCCQNDLAGKRQAVHFPLELKRQDRHDRGHRRRHRPVIAGLKKAEQRDCL